MDGSETDIYNIQDFSEEEFNVTLFNMGVSTDVFEQFKDFLDDCNEENVLNKEFSLAIMEGKADDSEIEELQNKLAEKESLIEQLEIKTKEIKKQVEHLEDERKALQEKCNETDNMANIVNEIFIPELFPVNKEEGSVSSLVAAKIVDKKFNYGDKVKKGDIIAIAEYKGISFEITAPNDGYVFYYCGTDALSIGQKIAFVREKRYEILKEVFAGEYDGMMPRLPYHKEMKINKKNTKGGYSVVWGEMNCIILYYPGKLGNYWEEQVRFHYHHKDQYVELIGNEINDICHYDNENETDELFVIPLFNATATVKHGQKIVEIVREIEND